jgi:peptidoglycan hydrolase FlgJ
MTKLAPAPLASLPAQASPAQASPPQASPAQASRTQPPPQALSQGHVPPQARIASGLSRPSQAADPARLAKSARDFEAMAIGQLLQPMFDTVDTAHNSFGGGAGEEAWKPMLVQEFAKQIEAHGGLGLAKPVYDAMLRMQGTSKK